MTRIAVHKSREAEPASFMDEIEALFEEIRQRAFSMFEERGHAPGRDLDDWLEAERQVLWLPPVEVIENQQEFRIRVAVPGIDATNLQVTAMPDAIVVRTKSVKPGAKHDGNAVISELSGRRLYRRLELKSEIDVEKVTGALDKGMLHLVAPKAEPTAQIKSRATAAAQTR